MTAPVERVFAAPEQTADQVEPIELDRPAPPLRFRPFPVDVLPEPLHSFVVDQSKAIPCDPSFIALPLLSALGAAIGTTHRIMLKSSWKEFAIFWTAIVARSGAVKSPAFDAALQSVFVRQQRAMGEYKAEVQEHDKARVEYEAELNDSKKSGRKHGEPPPKAPEKPVLRQVFVDDVTVEALAPRLAENERGILVAREELSGWFGSFNQYKNARGADEAHWLKMHGGRVLKVDRKTGDMTTIFVPRAAVWIAGTVQPKVLQAALGQEHLVNGIAARFLFAMPEPSQKRWSNHNVDPVIAKQVDSVFDRLYSLEHKVNEHNDPEPVDLPVADDAMALVKEFVNKHGLEQVNLDDDLSAAWAKLEGYAFRFALVIHLVRWAAGDPALNEIGGIDAVSIRAGIRLAEWFCHEARRIYAMLSESDEGREQRQLVEWIRRRGGSATFRDLTHGLSKFRNDAAEARKAVQALVEAGFGQWVTPAPGPKGGRPTERFKLYANTKTPDDDPASGGFGCGDSGDVGETQSRDDSDWGEL